MQLFRGRSVEVSRPARPRTFVPRTIPCSFLHEHDREIPSTRNRLSPRPAFASAFDDDLACRIPVFRLRGIYWLSVTTRYKRLDLKQRLLRQSHPNTKRYIFFKPWTWTIYATTKPMMQVWYRYYNEKYIYIREKCDKHIFFTVRFHIIISKNSTFVWNFASLNFFFKLLTSKFKHIVLNYLV